MSWQQEKKWCFPPGVDHHLKQDRLPALPAPSHITPADSCILPAVPPRCAIVATLSMEYAICCRHHSLTLSELFALARRSIAFTLVNKAEKAALCADFDSRLATLKEKFKIR